MQVLTTVDYANDYFESKPNVEKWDEVAYSSGDKWIAEATRRIYAIEGINIPDFENDAVPDDLQQACCEVVYELLNTGDENNPHNKNKKLGIASISFGKDSVSYSNDTTSGFDNAIFSSYAQSLLNKYIRKAYPYV